MKAELCIDKGYCHCGCGEKTELARQNNKKYGWKIGEPFKFIQGHATRINPSNKKGKKTGPSPARILEKDMVGIRYGRLIVDSLDCRDSKTSIWNCICDCGNKCKVKLGRLRNGTTKSCGCYQSECRVANNRTHGMSLSKEYELMWAAKYRAKKKGLEFNIDAYDVIIPEVCPYLGIKIENGTLGNHDASPSLDRIDSSKGYIKGNVEIISWKANQIKNNGTAEEHIAIGTRLLSLQKISETL
jgi:hypothetical protein